MNEDVFRWAVTVGVALAALAMVAQAFVMFRLYRASQAMNERFQSLSERAEPILESARRILEETRPKITLLTDQTLEMVSTAKAQMERMDQLLTETGERARVQMARLEAVAEDLSARVQETSAIIQHSILRPVREVNGVVAGIRVALGALARGGSRPSVASVTQDEEMFI